MTVRLDSLMDSIEVRAADSLVFVRAGELSRCVTWDSLPTPQQIDFRVWDEGEEILGWGGIPGRRATLPWPLERAPNIRVWGQQVRYDSGVPVPGYYSVGWTRVSEECGSVAGSPPAMLQMLRQAEP